MDCSSPDFSVHGIPQARILKWVAISFSIPIYRRAIFLDSSLWLPRWLSGQESTCKCRRRRKHRLDPWVRKVLWRRSWQLTPVFLTGEFHGQRSLVGYRPWGHKESDVTEATWHTHGKIYRCPDTRTVLVMMM